MERLLLGDTRDQDDDWATDALLHDRLEDLTSNSDLEWIEPHWIGALSAAPFLGIFGPEVPAQDPATFPGRIVGSWPDFTGGPVVQWGQEVAEAWGYPFYALRSPLDDLLERGRIEFRSEF